MLINTKGEEEPAVHTVVHSGKQLREYAIDLSDSPDCVLNQIWSIAEEVRTKASVRSQKLMVLVS